MATRIMVMDKRLIYTFAYLLGFGALMASRYYFETAEVRVFLQIASCLWLLGVLAWGEYNLPRSWWWPEVLTL